MQSDADYEAESEDVDSEKELTHFVSKHKCTVEGCNAVFLKRLRLEQHLNVHQNKRPYKCSHEGCDKSYTNSSHLKRHVQTHSVVAKTYECRVCSVKLSTLSNLKRHYSRIHNPKRELFCIECSLYFIKKYRYEEHMESHKNSSLFKCETCGKMFQTHKKLVVHQKHHMSKKIHKCPVENCSEVFDKWAMMLKHKRTEHSNDEYICADCSKVFTKKSSYITHVKIHADNRPAIPCPYEQCNRLYYFKRNLNYHIKTKHIGKKFHCDICGHKLSTKQKIKEHIINIHLSEKKPFKRKAPKARKDAGTAKKSMLSELTGMRLTVTAEKQLMKRNPTALQRDVAVEDPSSYSEDELTSDFSAKGA